MLRPSPQRRGNFLQSFVSHWAKKHMGDFAKNQARLQKSKSTFELRRAKATEVAREIPDDINMSEVLATPQVIEIKDQHLERLRSDAGRQEVMNALESDEDGRVAKKCLDIITKLGSQNPVSVVLKELLDEQEILGHLAQDDDLAIQSFCEQCPDFDLNKVLPSVGETAFVTEFPDLHYYTVETLLRNGADPNAKDQDGVSVLEMAVENSLVSKRLEEGHVADNGKNVAMLLLAYGADPSVIAEDMRPAFVREAKLQERFLPEFMEYAASNDAKSAQDMLKMIKASHGYQGVVDLLKTKDRQGMNALLYACKYSAAETARLIIETAESIFLADEEDLGINDELRGILKFLDDDKDRNGNGLDEYIDPDNPINFNQTDYLSNMLVDTMLSIDEADPDDDHHYGLDYGGF